MFGLQALDIALELIVVYLIPSLICTAANELIAGLFKLRARNLVEAVQNLLRGNLRVGSFFTGRQGQFLIGRLIIDLKIAKLSCAR